MANHRYNTEQGQQSVKDFF